MYVVTHMPLRWDNGMPPTADPLFPHLCKMGLTPFCHDTAA